MKRLLAALVVASASMVAGIGIGAASAGAPTTESSQRSLVVLGLLDAIQDSIDTILDVIQSIIERIDEFLEAVVDLLKTLEELFGGEGGD